MVKAAKNRSSVLLSNAGPKGVLIFETLMNMGYQGRKRVVKKNSAICFSGSQNQCMDPAALTDMSVLDVATQSLAAAWIKSLSRLFK